MFPKPTDRLKLPPASALAALLLLGMLAGSTLAWAQPVVTNVEATATDEVVVTFDVDIDPGTGSTLQNYRITEKDRPTTIVNIGSISVSANQATLSLSGFLTDITYSLLTNNIEPLGGGPGSALTFTEFVGPSGDFSPPTVAGATLNDASTVLIIFNEELDPTTAETPGNYLVRETDTPGNTIAVSTATLTSAFNVTLALAQPVADNVEYTLEVTNVEDLAGNAIDAQNTATFTNVVRDITPIADIQADTGFYEGRQVTVRGQVFIPTLSRGTTASGYIQDDSDRGLNIFGRGAEVGIMQDRTAIVEVTGTVELFFTTVEILDITDLRLVSAGNPRLVPFFLTTDAAANARWEGTYIQVSGTIQSQGEAGGAINYVVNDGSGQSVTVRVDNDLGAPTFSTGETITASGAGSQFQTTFQVTVGNADDIVLGAQFGFVLAFQTAPDKATLVFTAALDPDSVRDLDNYEVFTSDGRTVDVISADISPESSSRVDVQFSEAIDVADRWKIQVLGISDTEGTTIARPQVQTIAGAPVFEANLDGPARTFLPRENERYPVTLTVPQELTGSGGEIMLRIFDLTGRLQRTLYDSRFNARVFDINSQLTLEWDGLDEFSQRVPPGAYVAHLVVVDKDGGGRQEVQMPVVVATRLER